MPIFALYAYRGGINVQTLLFLRFVFSAVLLFSWLWANGQQVTVSRRQIGALFVMGAVFYALLSTCYFSALHYITPSLAVLLMYTYPIIVALLTSLVEKEHLSKKVLVPVAVSFFGLVLVLGPSFENISLIGVLLAFGSGVVYSCYIVMGNRLVKEMPSTLTSAWVALFASFSFLVTGLAQENLSFHFSPITWIPVVGIVLFSTVMALFTFFKGIELIGSARASALSMVEPIITILLSSILFGERMALLQIMGILVVLGGSLLVILWRKPKEEAM
jgi:drug/metabolite transporter (DMT)-like permease